MDVNKYIDAQLTQLNKTNLEYQKGVEKIQEAAKSEYHNFGGIQIRLSDEAISRNIATSQEYINQLKTEYSQEIDDIINTTEESLAAEKKKAIQNRVAAEPVPTDEQLRRADQIRQQYTTEGVFNLAKFNADMQFHIDNETVNAYPYYLIAIANAKGSGNSTQQRLKEIYLKLFPEVGKAEDNLKGVEEATRLFRIGVILFRQNTDESLKTPEKNLESIHLKHELYDLGYYSDPQQLVTLSGDTGSADA